jgi:hypothetical protein
MVTSNAVVGWLVGDEQVRLTRQRHRDHRTLTHPPGELVGVVCRPCVGLGNLDGLQHLDRPTPRLPVLCGPDELTLQFRRQRDRLADILVEPDGLGDLLPDGERRVQTVHRVLEHYRQSTATQFPAAVGGAVEQRLPTEPDVAVDNLTRLLDDSH